MHLLWTQSCYLQDDVVSTFPEYLLNPLLPQENFPFPNPLSNWRASDLVDWLTGGDPVQQFCVGCVLSKRVVLTIWVNQGIIGREKLWGLGGMDWYKTMKIEEGSWGVDFGGSG